MKVMHFPLAKISIAFILGLALAHFFKSPAVFCFIFFGISFAFAMAFSVLKHRHSFGIALLIATVALGFLVDYVHFEPNRPDHYLHFIGNKNQAFSIQIRITERLKSSINNERFVAELESVNGRKSSGKIILNLRKDSLGTTPKMGSQLHLEASFYKNKSPNNPNQFDYSNYLANQNIFAQIYAEGSNVKIKPQAHKNLNYYASEIRSRIISNLQKNHFKKDELSIVIALILGQQQDISKEVLRNYQYAGAVHILSVSGLHVGFILLFITTLLKQVPNSRKGTLIKLIITILSLWAFGLLAGMAPSVVRSVTMFSFVAVGLFLRRSVNIYHSLLVSMLLILMFRPSFLFDVGFQLSYLALFFIVWLQPLFKSAWEPKSKIIIYFWDIITVSLAAQIGTLPLSIYYFHQFPGLFFVTNIIVLPLLSIILAIALVVVVLAGFGWVPLCLMKVLEGSITILNETIGWVASFEDFIFKDIPMDAAMMWSAYLVIIALFFCIQKPNFRKIAIVFTATLVFQGSCIHSKFQTQKAAEFIVFHQKKKSMIIERNSDKVVVYRDDLPTENWALNSYLTANFSSVERTRPVSNFYFFKDKKIALIDSSGIYLNNNADVLILVNSPKINLERLLLSCKPKEIVADDSNFKSYRKLWKATCVKEKIPFHDTSEKGFYKL